MHRAHCPKVHAGPLFFGYSELNSGALGENLTLVVKNWPKFRGTSTPTRLDEVHTLLASKGAIAPCELSNVSIWTFSEVQIAILGFLLGLSLPRPKIGQGSAKLQIPPCGGGHRAQMRLLGVVCTGRGRRCLELRSWRNPECNSGVLGENITMLAKNWPT